MSDETLRIAKRLQPVTLWVHPEGRILGSIFLHLHSSQHDGEERPQEVLNYREPFLVLRSGEQGAHRFYNKRSIVRVQYTDELPPEPSEIVELPCRLHMMDGSLLRGVIREYLPPEHRRLFDYINRSDDHFIKLYIDERDVCLVNKAYIVRVTPEGDLPQDG